MALKIKYQELHISKYVKLHVTTGNLNTVSCIWQTSVS